MRYSKQRESIFRMVSQSKEHPTADMVYHALKDDIPKLSLGTVYRNLNQLSDAGRLKKIPLPDGSCRFDGTTRSHSHIVCSACGTVADVDLPHLDEIGAAVQQQTAYMLDSYDVVMRGHCGSCK